MNDQSLYGYITEGQSTPLPRGMDVSYSCDRPDVVRVKGDTLRTVGSGIATITATVRYHGGEASTTFTVDVAPLQFTSNPTTVIQAGNTGTFTVSTDSMPTATLTESGALPAGLTFTDNGDGTATITGTAPSATGTFPIIITAKNGVSPAVTQNFTLYVGSEPAITSSPSAVFTVGSAGAFTVATSGLPKPAITESGALPTGVTFTDNGDGTATLAGTPASGTACAYSVTLTADNGLTPATQALTLTAINNAPTSTTAVLAGTDVATMSFGTSHFSIPLTGIAVHLVAADSSSDCRALGHDRQQWILRIR